MASWSDATVDRPTLLKHFLDPFEVDSCQVGGKGKKVEPAQIEMDWSDICDLREWLRESSSFHNSNNVFFIFFLFVAEKP